MSVFPVPTGAFELALTIYHQHAICYHRKFLPSFQTYACLHPVSLKYFDSHCTLICQSTASGHVHSSCVSIAISSGWRSLSDAITENGSIRVRFPLLILVKYQTPPRPNTASVDYSKRSIAGEHCSRFLSDLVQRFNHRLSLKILFKYCLPSTTLSAGPSWRDYGAGSCGGVHLVDSIKKCLFLLFGSRLGLAVQLNRSNMGLKKCLLVVRDKQTPLNPKRESLTSPEIDVHGPCFPPVS